MGELNTTGYFIDIILIPRKGGTEYACLLQAGIIGHREQIYRFTDIRIYGFTDLWIYGLAWIVFISLAIIKLNLSAPLLFR